MAGMYGLQTVEARVANSGFLNIGPISRRLAGRVRVLEFTFRWRAQILQARQLSGVEVC